MKKDKDKTLDQVLADIEKQFGKGAIMKLGERGVKKRQRIPERRGVKVAAAID